MFKMDIIKFVTENALQLIPVYYIIGMMAKKAELIKDKYIPLLLVTLSLGFTPAVLNGFTDPQSYVQAILVVGAAVLVDQTIKQSKKSE